MYAERNSRLHCQGPASDRIHRLSRRCRTELRSHVHKGRSVVTGSTPESDFPRDYPFAATASLISPHTTRASPLLAGLSLGSLPARAIRLPDKEFRYLRTVIVTAAVYRGLASRLRPKANLSA